ncbi:hypothetical protein ACIBCH_20645 [Amycolatopsis thailandensis]|uniref:hypothetical protein n=1 Tax=Amycolatopsis thailandensis TaxID=589330 RepID=UPI0037A23071
MDTPVPSLDDLRNDPPTISVRRAALVLGVSPSHCHTLIRKDEFPCRVIPLGTRRHQVVTGSLVALLEGRDAFAPTTAAPAVERAEETPAEPELQVDPAEVESWFVTEPIMPPTLRRPGGEPAPEATPTE